MITSKDWEQYFDEVHVVIERNQELVKEKFKECEAYVDMVLKARYPDCGIVETNYEENLKDGFFLIWIDTGSITHKGIRLEDCGIEPLQLCDFPMRPDY